MVSLLLVIGGIIFLFLGGDGLISGSVAIAERFRLSTLLISTIVIGFGTSTPELVVSVDAALRGFPQIALGNVIGSNISNILLVLGTAATITAISCKTAQVKRDAIIGIFASIALGLISIIGYINRMTGACLVISLILYLSYITCVENIKKADKKASSQVHETNSMPLSRAAIITIISFGFLILGAHMLVEGAIPIAEYFGVSNAVIGLTLVAVGTSLPEWATAIIASYRKQPDIVLGNILGSNLFNILSIVGITAIIKPIPFTGHLATQDVWFMLGTSILLTLTIFYHKKIGRISGIGFLVIYVGYIYWLYS